MTLRLKHKIITLAVISALFPVVVMSTMTILQKKKLQDVVKKEISELTVENIRNVAIGVNKVCESTNNLLMDKVSTEINLALELLNKNGGLNLSTTSKIRWDAVNQFTKHVSEVTLPEMFIGNIPLDKNKDFTKPTPVVDEVKKLMGGTCTIFQRINEQGDMLRIATNVEDVDGRRAIGTYIPTINPDGKKNPVIATLISGNTFKGKVYLLKSWYVAQYEPIKDKHGEIIGCIYSGVKIEAVQSVKKVIQSTTIGKTGYAAILGATGENKGHYIISKDAARDGEDILDSMDANGKYFIKEMVENSVKLKDGEIGFSSYMWKNPEDPAPREKTAAYIYFEPWDWVIIATMYNDDYYAMYNELGNRINLLLYSVITGGIIFLILAALVAWIIGDRISKPITKISEIAKLIASGDLCSAMKGFKHFSGITAETGELDESVFSQKDETGKLITSIVTMTKNLNSLVGEVQKATINLVSTATEIAASSKEQEVTVNELSASSNEIVTSSKQISSTSQHLVATMDEVSEASGNTARLAEAGRVGLNKMEKSMEQLATATSSISSKLSIINEKTSNINNVVTTITKVADQTNLLSLNAAIEAEKAGEYGKGFSVVAREIRRLADQTAVATLDIIKMVREMQSAVSSGVMGMDKFSDEVRQSVKETEMVSGQIEGIIKEVQGLPLKFDLVIDGMKQQSTGAQQISDSMVQLNECAQSTSDSLRSFNEAAIQLNNATLNLQKEVSHFKVS